MWPKQIFIVTKMPKQTMQRQNPWHEFLPEWESLGIKVVFIKTLKEAEEIRSPEKAWILVDRKLAGYKTITAITSAMGTRTNITARHFGDKPNKVRRTIKKLKEFGI